MRLLSCMAAVSCFGACATWPPADSGSVLELVADVTLPGQATRFDYQDLDAERGRLLIAHMGDDAVESVALVDGAPVARATGLPTARGVAVAAQVNRVFVTCSPNQLVILDRASLAELRRTTTGSGPDAVAWGAAHHVVGVSAQRDGALSVFTDSGDGPRLDVKLGVETGNVVFDDARGWFWVTVVNAQPPDELVAVDPVTSTVVARLPLPGCRGAHGLRLHPNGASALVACESNSVLARIDLASHKLVTAPVGDGPDVLSVDPGLGWLYVAAESGLLKVFDLGRPGLVLIDAQHIADGAHSVAVDPTTHHVFFPLFGGPSLRIMRPRPR